MKIRLGDYTVDIEAKNDYNLGNDTLRFLNTLSIVFSEAAELNKIQGYGGCAKKYLEMGRQLYNFCNEKGLYGGLK